MKCFNESPALVGGPNLFKAPFWLRDLRSTYLCFSAKLGR